MSFARDSVAGVRSIQLVGQCIPEVKEQADEAAEKMGAITEDNVLESAPIAKDALAALIIALAGVRGEKEQSASRCLPILVDALKCM